MTRIKLLAGVLLISISIFSSAQDQNSESGYQGIAEIGYGFKVTTEGYGFLKVNIINGYRMNPNFYLGFGTGLRLYIDNNALFNSTAAYPVIPFFASFRVYPKPANLAPYLGVDLGYSFDASYGFVGLGILLNPMAGISFNITDKLVMNTGVGYDSQWASGLYFGAISINMGIVF